MRLALAMVVSIPSVQAQTESLPEQINDIIRFILEP